MKENEISANEWMMVMQAKKKKRKEWKKNQKIIKEKIMKNEFQCKNSFLGFLFIPISNNNQKKKEA